MNDCCANNVTLANYPKSCTCPANGKAYPYVARKTMLHHIMQPWKRSLTDQGYYFCSDPDCDVVYFGEDNTVFHKDELRLDVWQKSDHEHAFICYCFGITRQQARADRCIKTFVIEQTKKAICSCETSNPSGRCCLKDFPAER